MPPQTKKSRCVRVTLFCLGRLTVPDPNALFAQAMTTSAHKLFAVEEANGWRLGPPFFRAFGHVEYIAIDIQDFE
jgi:hypothetical protein